MAPLRLIFAGSGTFGAAILSALQQSSHTLSAVVSQPDRPAGRKLTPQPTVVSSLASELGLPLLHLETTDDQSLHALRNLSADVMIVADYGQLLPKPWLTLCSGGCLNVHASLLPRWRGAAPVARAIEAGDSSGGCTLMLMDQGLDTGDILLSQSVPFAADETTARASERLALVGSALTLRYLDAFDPTHPTRQAQDERQACQAPALRKEERAVDWQRPANLIACKIRAFNPAPITTCHCEGESLRLWNAVAVAKPAGQPPGTVLGCDRNGLWVAAREHRVCITELQRPGKRRMLAWDFCNAYPLTGKRLS